MDSYRDHPNDFDLPSSSAGSDDAAGMEIGTDERRMHVRAYNYWASLLQGRDYPSIEDLEPANVSDFAANSVLLDFTAGRDNPVTAYIGSSIREECGIGDEVKCIDDVPSRSLLSRLTDHYMQIIANRAPIGFEAEFVNQRGEPICYRGILMPFSSDGDTIDFIYGVINWKTAEDAAAHAPIAPAIEIAGLQEETVEEELAEVVPEEPAIDETPEEIAQEAPVHFSWEDGPLHDPDSDGPLPEIQVEADAGLADRLWAAREGADALKSVEMRSRTALYRALSLAYDFAMASLAEPDDYAELLEESGMKAQARAPMTPIAKLVFGIDYDKTRLTEFAAALSYAQRREVEAGGFQAFIETQVGGLKALVAAERQARRPEPKPDTKGEAARAKLRKAAPLALEAVASEAEFALVLARRRADGGVEAVALVDDEAMVERAIRRAAL